jgi:hypothetical protein
MQELILWSPEKNVSSLQQWLLKPLVAAGNVPNSQWLSESDEV